MVINDTVGFIRDLPKDLVEAFRATLEEIEDSDLIVHLVDGAQEGSERRIQAVDRLLDDLGYGGIPSMLVFNKCDRIPPDDRAALANGRDCWFLSARTKEGLETFLAEVERHLPPVGGFRLDQRGPVDGPPL